MPFNYPDISQFDAANKSRSTMQNILGAATEGYAAYQQAKEQKTKRQKDQLDFYMSMRKAGYSPQDSWNHTLKNSGLGVPGEMPEIEKEKAGLEEQKAKTSYWKSRAANPAGSVLSPNNIRLIIKDLEDHEDRGVDPAIEDQLQYYTQLLQEKTGYQSKNTLTPDQEAKIKQWQAMHPNKTREEIIQRAKEKGQL